MYLVFASAKDLLTKNASLCLLLSSSLNRVALTKTSETTRYTKSVSPTSRLARTGGSKRYCLIVVGLLLWAVIITVWEVARMLSSGVEYLSTRLYNYSIVVGGSRDGEWKNGVVGPKLLRKFWRIASILYESICWTTPQISW